MPEFDWMQEPEFREEITDRLKRAAAAAGMARYQPEIVDRLMNHMTQYRQLLVEQEMIKTAAARKTKNDALASVEAVIKRASELASFENRTLLETRDFDRAHQERFCMIWPFCGRGK